MENLTGKQFGPYQIVAALGEGGMAAVYKAYQPAMERFVALKVLPRQYAQDPDFVARFKREAKLLANLQHPHILPVFDFGEAEGYTYLVMPLLQSGSLTSLLKGQPLAWPLIRQIITQLGEALHYAHSHGLIHRDVKPSNVLLDESGNCLLSDFGLARMTESASKITNSGTVLGTPAYMAPEQGSGQNIDARSDLYALGVILYELITGRVPYRAETPVAVIFKHIQDPLPSARELNPAIPDTLERVLLKSLAKRPEDRFQTGADFVRALQAAISIATPSISSVEIPKSFETMMASTPPPHTQLGKKLPTGAWLVATFAGTVCILGGLGLALGAFLTGNLPIWNMVEPTATASLGVVAVQPSPTLLPVTATPTSSPTSTPTPTPTLGIGSKRRVGPDEMEQVFVPAGEFLMGSTDAEAVANADEKPQHRVYLDDFWIDRTEVTNSQYAICVQASACLPPQSGTYSNKSYSQHPVHGISWVQAQQYCQWAGRRLPTEAEWEKAARGANGAIYPWGNNEPTSKLANFANTVNDTNIVGSYPTGASPYGALDMAGNVWEWVADLYSTTYYAKSPSNNPKGPVSGDRYIVRGGAWDRRARHIRTAFRDRYPADHVGTLFGVRCAASSISPSTVGIQKTDTYTSTIAPVSVPNLTNFRYCNRPCDETGAIRLKVFPEKTTEVFMSVDYSGMQVGMEYVRTWSFAGQEWVRYNCVWGGPESGTLSIRLWDREGLRSGVWTVMISVRGGYKFQDVVSIDGRFDLWTPAGTLACKDWD